ncbi:DAK2 domain-containing protein [Promicromonospora sp. NPDC052451]|uniref:DAK2 domain-containing protein n=1 Tax=Promicromonospora sp. NPDC052451 TaxID=3364407 RepID=UPI0037C6670E
MTDVDSGSRATGPGPFPAGVRLDDPAVVRTWTRGATAALRRERGAIDRVNVFPVADADTGTNLYLTLREGERAVERAPADASGPELLATLARAALLGARGNSGVILSEWLRGLAVAARRGGDAADLLRRAAVSARSAVERPAEGTILTAADAAADAAADTALGMAADVAADTAADAAAGAVRGPEAGPGRGAGGDTAAVAAAAAAARAAARSSRDELDALRTAGVLDAGALGLVLVLDALVAAVSGLPAAPGVEPAPGGVSVADGSMDTVNLDELLDAAAGFPVPRPAEPHGAPHGTGALELMFVLTGPVGDGPESVAAGLRSALAEVGDSVVVVGGDAGTGTGVWQAHVHTDRLDAALAVAAAAGRAGTLAQVHVRHLEAAGQHEWGVVAATAAPALAAELARAGAVVLLTGGVEAVVEPLTPDDVGRAAGSTGARRVLFLGPGAASAGEGTPGVADTAAADAAGADAAGADAVAADAVAAGAGTPFDVGEVVAVTTPSDVHAVVALAALGTVLPFGVPADPGVDARTVVTDALDGLVVVTAGADGATGVLHGAAGPATTVVTALLDAGVPDDLPERLAATLAGRAPDAELVVLATGLPGDGVRLGVESGVGQETEGDA